MYINVKQWGVLGDCLHKVEKHLASLVTRRSQDNTLIKSTSLKYKSDTHTFCGQKRHTYTKEKGLLQTCCEVQEQTVPTIAKATKERIEEKGKPKINLLGLKGSSDLPTDIRGQALGSHKKQETTCPEKFNNFSMWAYKKP